MTLLGVGVFGAVLLLFLVWELYICEGAHFGRRFVVWLYDLAADRYDGIKGFDVDWEARFLGEPLDRMLRGLPEARLLDIGAGTGRTGRTLETLRARSLGGTQLGPRLLMAIEPSRAMARLGRPLAGERFEWVRAWADPLPVASESIDVLVCLEVLEFTPSPRASLGEMARVLRPGGWLLTSNRIGWQAPLILGRTFSRRRFPSVLRELGFDAVEVVPWQVDYDMAWARKAWN